MQIGKAQVLVVDDERSIRITLKEFLEEEGFAVTTAEGYVEAIELIGACDFDVAVIDRILSKDHSGLDLLFHINAAKPLCRTILITAYPTFESAQYSLRSGACDYLVKPFTRGEICRAVKKALQAVHPSRGINPECRAAE